MIEPGSIPAAALVMGMTAENFNFCMGLCGIVSAFTVLLIWSRGL